MQKRHSPSITYNDSCILHGFLALNTSEEDTLKKIGMGAYTPAHSLGGQQANKEAAEDPRLHGLILDNVLSSDSIKDLSDLESSFDLRLEIL